MRRRVFQAGVRRWGSGMSVEGVMAICYVTIAAGEDLWRGTISNWIPAAALISGLGLQALNRGWPGVGSALAGAACGVAVFSVFYWLGGMGGGDIKLMGGTGALLGPVLLWKAALWTAAMGGIWALAVLGFRRLRRSSKADIWAQPVAYAPAIGLGVLMAVVERL